MRRVLIPLFAAITGIVLAASLSFPPEEALAQAKDTKGSKDAKPKDAKAKKEEPEKPERTPDVIYVPTAMEIVHKMLAMAEVKKGDVVYDLGCGDGRILVEAAKKFGVKAVGFDIDPQRVKEALENVRTNNVEHLVTIKKADIFTLDLSEASVVTLYLLPELNVRLMPQLEKLKPGSRIVSHDFDMAGAKPKDVYQGTVDESSHEYTVYKWVVPWERQ